MESLPPPDTSSVLTPCQYRKDDMTPLWVSVPGTTAKKLNFSEEKRKGGTMIDKCTVKHERFDSECGRVHDCGFVANER